MGSDVLVEARDVKVHFPAPDGGTVYAVDGVSLEIRRGEVLGLVGESGCGKSTLGRAMLQLIRLTSGQVTFAGEDLTQKTSREVRALRRRMQIVFQDPRGSLNPKMRIGEIVEEPLAVHRIGTRSERQRAVAEMLSRVGLDPSYLRRRPNELSGGQLQRVGIARALIARPEFVVCDEPVSSLDVSIQAQVINLLQDLQRELGVTYLFIAHNLAVVRHISDRVAVMYLGQIAEIGPVDEVFRRPLHPYTQGLLAAILRPDTEARSRLALAEQLVGGDLPSPKAPPTGCRYQTRCPIRREKCRLVPPVLESADDGPQHRVACHFWAELSPLPAAAQAR